MIKKTDCIPYLPSEYQFPEPLPHTLQQHLATGWKIELFPKGFVNPLKTTKLVIINVIYNDPATIVFWEDGTKTVVKATNEPFDKEKGLAMAYVKRVNGNKGNFNAIFKKWCKEQKEKEESK